MYLLILGIQKKHKVALDALNGPLGQIIKIDAEREKFKMDLLKNLESWDVLFNAASDVWKNKFVVS